MLLVAALCRESKAQISPPGLGIAHMADWFALGIRQKLKRRKGWQSMSYIGMGRKSNPDNYNPALKPAILVLNHEFTHAVNTHYQYAFALSYRRQDEYLDRAPYKHQRPGTQQEIRAYGRLYYFLPLRRIKLAAVLRQELRKFYTPAFHNPEESLQLRSRLRLQMTVPLNKQKTHRLITGAEALFATSQLTGHAGFTPFAYEESRFTCYYSWTLKKLPFTLDVGYMSNLLGKTASHVVHYLAFDIIWENPFR
ncbi:hypothetical protein GCM10011379_21350 [Filimonas zeae]|uniref:DUF2490 domain-containing protein n=2 Tax=Filimonas zeae TaxID=1737353 RepID=A0A917MVK4_9BACT|nr:hypothetical protein GCM10011379_21350 [Filimonas zeae]